ncbi:MAG: hypothetical protein WCG98_09905 [bacterium]
MSPVVLTTLRVNCTVLHETPCWMLGLMDALISAAKLAPIESDKLASAIKSNFFMIGKQKR